MTNQAKQTVWVAVPFALLAATVVLGAAFVYSWSGLVAAPVALQASDDPLANRLQIVEPPARVRAAAQPTANGETATLLQNWVYTDDNTSQNR